MANRKFIQIQTFGQNKYNILVVKMRSSSEKRNILYLVECVPPACAISHRRYWVARRS